MKRGAHYVAMASVMVGAFLFIDQLANPFADFLQYSSDVGIPTLMMQSDIWRWEDLYFWGQGRFGAWPYLILRVFRMLLGAHWGSHVIFYAQILALLSAVYPLHRLFRPDFALGFMIFGVWSLLFFPLTYSYSLNISQPYGFHIATLIWAIFLLVRYVQTMNLRFGVGATIFTWLTCSLVPLGVFYLGSVLLCLFFGGADRRSKRSFKQLLWCSLPIFFGFGCEVAVSSAFKHYIDVPSVSLAFEGSFVEVLFNLKVLYSRIARSTFSWIIPVGFVAYGSLFYGPIDDRIQVLRGLVVAAVLNLLLLSSLCWVRLNGLDGRYVTGIYSAMILFSMVSIYFAAEHYLKPRFRAFLCILASVVLVVGAIAKKESQTDHYNTKLLKVTDLFLDKYKGEGAILYGSYWGTYSLAAILNAHGKGILPVPSFSNRTPWVLEDREAPEQLFLSHIGTDGKNIPEFLEVGRRYRLVEEKYVGLRRPRFWVSSYRAID